MADDTGATYLADNTEDFPKATWDFWRSDGTQIDTIPEMSAQLCISELDVAALVINYPVPDAVPLNLFKEAADVLRR